MGGEQRHRLGKRRRTRVVESGQLHRMISSQLVGIVRLRTIVLTI
jgi:hypothetical protein